MLDIDVRDRNEQRNFAWLMASAFVVLGLIRWWHRGELSGWMIWGGLAYFVLLMTGARLAREPRAILGIRYAVATVAVVGLVLLRNALGVEGFPAVLMSIAAAFLVVGAMAPVVLQPVLWAWIRLAIGLNWLITRIVLTFVFVVMFIPVRVLFQLFGNDPLNRTFLPAGESYWEEADEQPDEMERYFNQF